MPSGRKCTIKALIASAFATAAAVALSQPVAACQLPFDLQNGTFADASQVMANYNVLVTCLQELEAKGEDYAIQYKSDAGQTTGEGPLTDGQLLTGVTGGAPVGSALQAGTGIKITSGPGHTKVALMSTGESGSLYSQVLSPTPASSWTGLNNWFNQASTLLTESPVGTSISAPSSGANQNVSGRFMPAPTPPYSITALVAATANTSAKASAGIGWYDGTGKLHVVSYLWDNGNSPYLEVQRWNGSSTLDGADYSSFRDGFNQPIWLQLNDDGANVSFAFSQDGLTFNRLYTTSKSSGWLGATGYSNVIFFLNPNGGPTIGTLMSWRVD